MTADPGAIGMAKKQTTKHKDRLGLDIGSHSIKLVLIAGDPGRQSLGSVGLKRIVGSSRDAVISSIKSLTEELAITGKDVAIGVAGRSVIVRLISMPKMTDEELAGAVRFEAEKFIPFDINDCVLDFKIIGKETKEKNTLDILLAAVKKEYVLHKIRLVEEAGFAVRTVDVDILAATNAFLANFPSQDPSKTLALLDVGASCTDVSILRGGVPSFVRQVPIGISDCSAAVAKVAGVSPEEAASVKALPADKQREVIVCAKQILMGLIDEIKMSFGYYENQGGRGIDEIYVAGGGSSIVGLDEAFGEVLGAKPRHWDPFKFLDQTAMTGLQVDECAKTTFGVAVGLALR